MSKPLVLVSGGNRGIGLETCRALAARGARVLLGARRLSEGEGAAKLLASAGDVAAVALDAADPKSVAALKIRVEEEFGVLDVLINNAGVYSQENVLEASEEEVESVLETNLSGAWRLCRAFVPAMKARGRGRASPRTPARPWRRPRWTTGAPGSFSATEKKFPGSAALSSGLPRARVLVRPAGERLS